MIRIDGMKVNKYNIGCMSMYIKPPIFLKKKTIYFKLNAGDALFLPKGWWHYISSEENTLSVNIFDIKTNFNKPHIIKTSMDHKLINLDDINFYNWYNKDGNILGNITLSKYSKKKTWNIWKNKQAESNLRDIIYKNINVENKYNKNKSINIWNYKLKHNSQLHYDNGDNILIVLKGTKHVKLIPPKFTKYLFPLEENKIYPNIKNNFFMFDRGIRAYGDAFWQSPNLIKKIHPLLVLFCILFLNVGIFL